MKRYILRSSATGIERRTREWLQKELQSGKRMQNDSASHSRICGMVMDYLWIAVGNHYGAIPEVTVNMGLPDTVKLDFYWEYSFDIEEDRDRVIGTAINNSVPAAGKQFCRGCTHEWEGPINGLCPECGDKRIKVLRTEPKMYDPSKVKLTFEGRTIEPFEPSDYDRRAACTGRHGPNVVCYGCGDKI